MNINVQEADKQMNVFTRDLHTQEHRTHLCRHYIIQQNTITFNRPRVYYLFTYSNSRYRNCELVRYVFFAQIEVTRIVKR